MFEQSNQQNQQAVDLQPIREAVHLIEANGLRALGMIWRLAKKREGETTEKRYLFPMTFYGRDDRPYPYFVRLQEKGGPAFAIPLNWETDSSEEMERKTATILDVLRGWLPPISKPELKAGRKLKSTDRLSLVLRRAIRRRDPDLAAHRWKDFVRNHADDLPRNVTPDQVRMRCQRLKVNEIRAVKRV